MYGSAQSAEPKLILCDGCEVATSYAPLTATLVDGYERGGCQSGALYVGDYTTSQSRRIPSTGFPCNPVQGHWRLLQLDPRHPSLLRVVQRLVDDLIQICH